MLDRKTNNLKATNKQTDRRTESKRECIAAEHFGTFANKAKRLLAHSCWRLRPPVINLKALVNVHSRNLSETEEGIVTEIFEWETLRAAHRGQ